MYLSRQEVQASTIRTDVDKSLISAKQPELIGVTTDGRTVYLK